MEHQVSISREHSSSRSRRSKRSRSRKKSVYAQLLRKLKRDPLKILGVFFGALLLIYITVQFILYAQQGKEKKSEIHQVKTE